MRNVGVIILLIVLPFFGISQEIKVTSGIGYAIAATDNLDKKKLMLCKELATGLSVPILGQLLYLDFSIGIRHLLFESSSNGGADIFNKWSYLFLPVSVTRHYNISRRSNLYWSFGLNAGYLFRIEREDGSYQVILPGAVKIGECAIGVNGGIGFQTRINNKLSFSIGYLGSIDIWRNKRNSESSFKMERRMLSTSFLLNLK